MPIWAQLLAVGLGGVVAGLVVGRRMRAASVEALGYKLNMAEATARGFGAKLEAAGADLQRLEFVRLSVQELSRCIVRLDSGQYLASTKLFLEQLQRLRVVTHPAEGDGAPPWVQVAGDVVEAGPLVVESLESAKSTMLDVRELLAGIAGRIANTPAELVEGVRRGQ